MQQLAQWAELNYLSLEWRDPVIEALFWLFSLEGQGAYVILQFSILALGCYTLFRVLKAQRSVSVAGTLATVLAIGFIMGTDPFFLRSHWFPFLTASFVALRVGEKKAVVMLPLACLVWSFSAGALGFLGVGVSAFSGLLLGPKSESGEDLSRLYAFAVVVALLISLFVYVPYDMSRYPETAMLAPAPSPSAGLPALIGGGLSPDPIVHNLLREWVEIYWSRFLAVLLLFTILAVSRRRSPFSEFSSGAGVLIIGICVLSFEMWPSAATPYQLSTRLIPHLGYAPLPWLIIPPVFVLGMSLIVSRVTVRFLSALAVLLISVLFIENVVKADWPLLRPLPDYPDHLAQAPRKGVDLISASPSAFVLRAAGEWTARPGIAEERNFQTLARLYKERDFNWEIEAQPKSERADRAVDGNARTRWATGRPQEPGDFIHLRFDRPVKVARVVLSSKASPNDYPRGIRVEGSVDEESYFTIVEHPTWFGPVRWTKDGYPYFGPRSAVIIDFPQEVEIKALKFTQTGTTKKADWSVNEIKLYQLP